ncbi:hypothetical protein ATJ97_0302 [Georgenia soli]|uniref:Uncharacterized protein n=1 Tax=Georgenia soli TaxID=638953 RepID=A0A2A9F3N2_9MICO|nr:hypothetical protein [Georgenia soli]PFG45019.1 hypothetical protein ATJ97_0302 [Georgenia soli]
MKHTRIAAAVAAAALTLAGCSTGNAEPKKAEPQEDGAITTIEKLHQAFVDAGGTCKELSPRNVTAATDAADCDDDTVLMVFTDEKAANAHASEMTAMGSNVLVGDAFVINSELQELRKVVRSLNGVVSMATEGHEETPAAAPTPKPTPTTHRRQRREPETTPVCPT